MTKDITRGDGVEFTCPCCGYKTLGEEPPGTFNICNICFWEDDGFQYHHPDVGGGANTPSLREAQKNYMLFGACEQRCMKFVREPDEKDIKDPDWEPL